VHLARCRIARESAGEAGVDAEGLWAMAALDGQEEVVLPLDAQACQGSRPLSQVSLDDIARAGVLDQAVDLTEAAAHAEVFQGVDAADSGPCSVRAGCAAQGQVPLIGKARLVAYGNRLPLAYHLSEDVSRGRIGSLFGPLEEGRLRLGGGHQGAVSLDEWARERQREKPLAESPSARTWRSGSAGSLLLQG
jgi:hypothetical protein